MKKLFLTASFLAIATVSFAQTAVPANPLRPTAPAVTVPATPAAKPTIPAAKATAEPKAKREVSPGQLAARERQKKCGVEWKEAKAANKTAGQKWPQFWSACNKRLKAA